LKLHDRPGFAAWQAMMRPLSGINRTGALWLGFFALILAAWAGLFAVVQRAPLTEVPAGFWDSLCLGAGSASFSQLAAMWALMAAAMMLPTFVPALRTFLDLGQAGATKPLDAVALVAGYALIWLGGAALAAGVQQGLAASGWLAPNGTSLSQGLTVVLLATAGLYQFSILKAACLAKCRMPLTFFMQRWAPGPEAALRMGVELGLLCLGCCWALMALAFVGGTMNLLWMGAATLFMVLEKLPDLGRYLTRPAGLVLLGAAGFIALRAGTGL
jgi:predicted metal-binding membrane protein